MYKVILILDKLQGQNEGGGREGRDGGFKLTPPQEKLLSKSTPLLGLKQEKRLNHGKWNKKTMEKVCWHIRWLYWPLRVERTTVISCITYIRNNNICDCCVSGWASRSLLQKQHSAGVLWKNFPLKYFTHFRGKRLQCDSF